MCYTAYTINSQSSIVGSLQQMANDEFYTIFFRL